MDSFPMRLDLFFLLWLSDGTPNEGCTDWYTLHHQHVTQPPSPHWSGYPLIPCQGKWMDPFVFPSALLAAISQRGEQQLLPVNNLVGTSTHECCSSLQTASRVAKTPAVMFTLRRRRRLVGHMTYVCSDKRCVTQNAENEERWLTESSSSPKVKTMWIWLESMSHPHWNLR